MNASAAETLDRLEALLISLRDQVDALADRMETHLSDQHRALRRLEAQLAELSWQVREVGLDVAPGSPRELS
jgi:hypothetical protein